VRANKKARSKTIGLWEYGGAEGDRTLDLCIANAALSQLSYRPSISAVLHDGEEQTSILLDFSTTANPALRARTG
jgi:hypothetical protein